MYLNDINLHGVTRLVCAGMEVIRRGGGGVSDCLTRFSRVKGCLRNGGKVFWCPSLRGEMYRGNCRGIKPISQAMKFRTRVVEVRLRLKVSICEPQYGFM